ncbi:MAG: hypothetical protein IJS71_06160 [Clostridia bacterium]|nr:hypothetical protein [Clostridia bacterium]
MFLNTKAIKRFFRRGRPGPFTHGAKDSFILHTGNAILGGAEQFDYATTRGKIVFSVFAAALAIFVQEAFFNDLRIFGTKPNILLALLVLISMSSDGTFSMFLGLFSGLAVDISLGRYIGFYGLIYMYFCIITAAVVRPAFKGKMVFYISSGPVFITLYTLVEGFGARFLSLYASRAPVLYEDFFGHLLYRTLPSSLYTYVVYLALLVPVTYALGKLGRGRRKAIDFRG